MRKQRWQDRKLSRGLAIKGGDRKSSSWRGVLGKRMGGIVRWEKHKQDWNAL